MCCPARSVDGWRIRGLRSWPVCQVATQLAATKPTTPFELQFLSLLTSAKARIDTHLLHQPSTFKGLLLLPACPSSTPRSSDLPSFFISSSPTRHHTNLLLRFSRTRNAEQPKRRKKEEEQLEVFPHSPISRPHYNTQAQPIHTHIRGASENLN